MVKRKKTWEYGKDWVYMWAKPKNIRKYAKRYAERFDCKLGKIDKTSLPLAFGEQMYIVNCKKKGHKQFA